MKRWVGDPFMDSGMEKHSSGLVCRRVLCSAALSWWVASSAGSVAHAADLAANAADGVVNASSVIATGDWWANVGREGSDRALIIPFQLPSLSAGLGFSAADLRMELFNISGTPTFNADVYGLTRVAAAADIQASDFYIGAFDETAWLIQDNFFVPTSGTGGSAGVSNSNATGDANLTDWLNLQYDDGANAGKYVFLRVNVDAVPSGNIYYVVLTQNAGGATEKPLITYTAVAYTPPPDQEIAVVGPSNTVIASGDTSPSTADGTDFGSLDLHASAITRTFAITNTGGIPLALTGSPRVTVTGAGASEFTVTAQPSFWVGANAASAFTLKYLPLSSGTRQATISIANNDADENPYTFTVQGTGEFEVSDYPNRMQVQLSGYGRAETLTNFPALMVLNTGITNFSYASFLSATGGDLRFVDSTQTRLLRHEIETWNTNGSSYIWVRVPALAGTTTAVWAVWGNPAQVTAPAFSTNGETWSESYVGVWHLGETSGSFKDSVSTNHGTLVDANANAVRGTNSLIGGGIRLAGSETDFIEIANEANFKLSSNLTLMVWAKGLSGQDWAPWVSKRGETAGYALRKRAGGAPDWCTRGTTVEELNGPTVDAANWHFIAGTLSAGATKTKRLFIDGAVAAENTGVTGNIADTPDNLLIGARTNATAYWGGIIDEVRVSRIARSTNWVWAEFQNSASNGIFNSYASVSGGPEIGVLGTNLASIADGSGSASVALGTDFGTVSLSTGAQAERIFTITNSGNAALTLSGSPILALSGAAASDFSLIAGPTRTNLTPGQTATFTLRFQPSATGTRAAQVSLGSDDGDENPYTFIIAGTGLFSPIAYDYQLPLQFCGYTRDETLTNFPVLVVLNTAVPGFSYSQFKGANGGDLRFSDGAQANLLNFEIDSWDPSGSSYVWVQVPALSNASASIYAYWGNTNATTLPAYATNGAAWSERFAGVWHLAETSGASRDSTTNGLTGYPSNGITQAATGQIGGGDSFPGSGSRTYFGTPAVLNNLTNSFTASAWIMPDVLGGNRIVFGAHWGSLNGWSFRLTEANPAIERLPGGTLNSGVGLTADQWAAVTVVYDAANDATFYINGVKVATVAGTTAAGVSTQPWYLGANNGDYFIGVMDEVQVSQVARSSNWIWAAYQNTASNGTFTCAGALQGPSELLVLGTNGAIIASGSAAASAADGSDFGLVPVSTYREQTFQLTNAGVGTLTITGVTTAGVHQANFSVRSFPTSLDGRTAGDLVIRFTPPGGGARTATVTVASSDEATPAYSFTVVGRDSSAGIAVDPTSFALTAELGTNFTRTLAVTNIGSISIPYSFTSDVPWITSADAGLGFTNGSMAAHAHTLAFSFTNPICSAGVYTGRVVVTAPLATNSPKVVMVVATVNGPPPPTSVSATASGQEMVRLAWQPTGGNPVMIVYREGAAPSADPAGCSTYAVGASLGGGSVLYVGSGSSLEHLVDPDAVHHYRLYTVKSNQFYSSAVAVTAATAAYDDDVLLAESFSYTNGLSLSGRDGGIGWTSAWAGANTFIGVSTLGSTPGFEGGLGNSATNESGSQMFRGFPALSAASGPLYLSFQLRYQGTGFAGLSLFDGATEQMFIGQKSAAHEFGVVYYGGTSPSRGAHSMAIDTDYTILAKLDIASGAISASCYTNGVETVPGVEPVTWQINATGPTTSVWNRLRMAAGVGSAFDEIRVGHTWRDVVVGVSCPPGVSPTLVPVTDKTVTSNTLLSFTVTAYDFNCSAPSLSATGLPAGATFTASPSGTNQVGTFSWTPQVVGTFPVRFIADDGLLTTSRVIRIYVATNGEPLSGGIPVSQTNWSVAITNLIVPSSGNATVVWQSVDGVTYDLYSSAQPLGAGASWSKVVSAQEAEGASATASVSAASSNIYYQVVPQGQSTLNRGVWGIVRPTIPSAFHLMSPPVLGDRSFADDGAFGQALAAAVPEGAKIHIATDAAPNWITLEQIGGVWRTDPDTQEYTTPLAAGQAFYLQGASGAYPVFVGPVGNQGTQSVDLAVGFNLLGVSEGKGMAASTAFESATPIGNNNENLADMIVIQHANGTWRRLVRQTTPSNRWYDMTTRGATSVVLMPGEAYYYIRRTSATEVDF